MNPSEMIALIDMDGTICDYEGAMLRDLLKLKSPAEIENVLDKNTDLHALEKYPHMKERMKLIKANGDWWENLPILDIGFEIMNMLTQDFRFRLMILTQGPRNIPIAWSHKLRWLQKNCPGVDVTMTRDKGLVYGKILVDDWPPYCLQWLEHRPRGLVIMPEHRYNVDFKHPNVIHATVENLGAVKDRVNKLMMGPVNV